MLQALTAMVLWNTTVGGGASVAANGSVVYAASGSGFHVLDAQSGETTAKGPGCGAQTGVDAIVLGDAVVGVLCREGMITVDSTGKTVGTYKEGLSGTGLGHITGDTYVYSTVGLKKELRVVKVAEEVAVATLQNVEGTGVTATNSTIFALGTDSMTAFDVANPSTPQSVATVLIPNLYGGNYVAWNGEGGVLAVSGAGTCLTMVTYSGAVFSIKGTISGGNGLSAAFSHTPGRLYAACDRFVHSVDISNPTAPKVTATYTMPQYIEGLAVTHVSGVEVVAVSCGDTVTGISFLN